MKGSRAWLILVGVALLAAGGAGYLAYTRYSASAQTPQEQILQTGTVQRGDLVLTADGTGNLFPGSELKLAFKVNGIVTELNVEVGDKVQQGDVLARLDTTELYVNLQQATYQLELARLELQENQRTVEAGTNVEIAKRNVEIARLAWVNAQGSYASTLLSDNVNANVRQAEFEAAYWAGVRDEAWQRLNEQPDNENRQRKYEEACIQADRAANEVKRLQQDAQNQKVSGWRNVLSAQQTYLTALSNYSDTLSSDPLRAAELAVLQNEINVTQAQMNLENATLTAPISGTVTEVTARVGENAGTAPVITLIDLNHPLVRFWTEETDLGKVVVGNKVNVTFDALPDETFTGKIVRVDPVLVTVGNTSAVQAWASLDDTSHSTLLSGMTAEVEVVAAEARDALLVPVQALREIATGQYAVFVLAADGSLEMRLVQVGLKDLVNAEIVSGLEGNEVVSLGTQSSRTTQSNTSNPFQDRGGGMMFIEGGGPMGGGGFMPPGGMP